MKKGVIIGILLIFICFTHAQTPARVALKFEAGVGTVTTTDNKAWDVRQDVGMYYYDYNSSYGNGYRNNSSNVYPSISLAHFAVKPEVSFFNDKLAVSSGISFNFLISDMASYGYNDNEYFYLRYNTTDVLSEYAKVKTIIENTTYMGIPIDVKFSPFSFWKMDFYLKTGIDINYKLGTKTDIQFLNESMESSEQLILNKTDINTNNLLSVWTNGIGVTFGNKEKLRYSVEYILPSVILTNNNSTIANANLYYGFRFSVQFNLLKINVK